MIKDLKKYWWVALIVAAAIWYFFLRKKGGTTGPNFTSGGASKEAKAINVQDVDVAARLCTYTITAGGGYITGEHHWSAGEANTWVLRKSHISGEYRMMIFDWQDGSGQLAASRFLIAPAGASQTSPENVFDIAKQVSWSTGAITEF